MPEGEANIPSPFDVRTIKYLVRLMGRFDLSEVDLREGDLRIRLRRGQKSRGGESVAVIAQPPAATPMAHAPAAPTGGAAPSEAASRKLVEVKSPTPGTFYVSPKPGAEPYVKVGSKVQPDTVVCIIEAMKVYNEVTADCHGTVVEILVENQQPVEYGQALFRIDPST